MIKKCLTVHKVIVSTISTLFYMHGLDRNSMLSVAPGSVKCVLSFVLLHTSVNRDVQSAVVVLFSYQCYLRVHVISVFEVVIMLHQNTHTI